MITVVCPVFNEELFISGILEMFISWNNPDKELLIIDGGSTDRTRSIVEDAMKNDPSIRLLDNPDRYVPFALNRAIRVSSGDPVIRLDAHTEYAGDYFEAVLKTFEKSGADIVGGPMRVKWETAFQHAVAIATTVSFGIGDSSFHFEDHEGYVDSVYLGAWRRGIFAEIGYFDEQLYRNQDDEFHYRANAYGKKIYLDPAIRSWYTPRSNFLSLFRQYYQYGLFKPLVLRKVKSGFRIRHLIPSGFVLYCLSLVLLYSYPLFLVPATLYILILLYFVMKNFSRPGVAWRLFLVFPVLHISYGAGFLAGLFRMIRKGGKL